VYSCHFPKAMFCTSSFRNSAPNYLFRLLLMHFGRQIGRATRMATIGRKLSPFQLSNERSD